MNPTDLITTARAITQELGKTWDNRPETILNYCLQSPDFKAFPKFAKLDLTKDTSAYLRRYLQRYFVSREQRLNLRVIGTTPDPAVEVILRAFTTLENLDLVSAHHRQSMAAENLLGELLERYIAEKLESNGWVWCAGNTVRSIDFLREDLSIALQIKNRDNSENSSSAAVRQGTNIQKWFRVYSKTGQTNWNNFPQASGLSEEGFHSYIENYAKSLK